MKLFPLAGQLDAGVTPVGKATLAWTPIVHAVLDDEKYGSVQVPSKSETSPAVGGFCGGVPLAAV